MDNTDIVQMVKQVGWIKRCQLTYASNLHVFVQTIFMFEIFILNSIMCLCHLSPTEKCEAVSAPKDSCFLFHEIDIYYKPSTMQWLSASLGKFLVWKFGKIKVIYVVELTLVFTILSCWFHLETITDLLICFQFTFYRISFSDNDSKKLNLNMFHVRSS